RYQSADDVRLGLERIEQGVPTGEKTSFVRRPGISREITVTFGLKRLIVPAAIVFCVIVTAWFIFFKNSGPRYDPKRVLVAAFENKTGDKAHDSLAGLIASSIKQGLSKTGLAEDVTPPSYTFPLAAGVEKRLRATAKEMGAGTLISGSYYLQGTTLSFHALVTDMSRGKLIKALDPISGSTEDPSKAIDLLQQKVLGLLAWLADPKYAPIIEYLGQPPAYEAFKELQKGDGLREQGDFGKQPLDHFLRAAELDPSYMPALIWLAQAYGDLGEGPKVDEHINKLEEFRDTLGPLHRLQLDVLKARREVDLPAALETQRKIVALNPVPSEQFKLALGALHNNRPREAIQTLSKIDPIKGMKDSWNYWWVMTRAHHLLGNYSEELKQARLGRKRHPTNLWLFIFEAIPLAAMGKMEDVNKLVDESLTLPSFRDFLDIDSGTLMIYAALEYRSHDYKEASLQLLDRAARWLEARPDKERDKRRYFFRSYGPGGAADMSDRWDTLYLTGRWDDARALYEAALREEPENWVYLSMIGLIAARRGERAKAIEVSNQLEEMNKPSFGGWPAYAQACIASLLGDKENAVRLLREAFNRGVSFDNQAIYADDPDLETLRNSSPFKEFIKPKG
ncbi:MAG: hypothetical protein NT147_01590, partial [Candidatus Aminicenantes bacterium]|nr:hypothetical protein [Candidatus Aminicenantes bacterium]